MLKSMAKRWERYNSPPIGWNARRCGPSQQLPTAVSRMIALAARLPDFDVARAMFSGGGERLAAYAHLYALPDPTHLEGLTRSLRALEPRSTHRFLAQPFELYWG